MVNKSKFMEKVKSKEVRLYAKIYLLMILGFGTVLYDVRHDNTGSWNWKEQTRISQRTDYLVKRLGELADKDGSGIVNPRERVEFYQRVGRDGNQDFEISNYGFIEDIYKNYGWNNEQMESDLERLSSNKVPVGNNSHAISREEFRRN